MSGNRPQPPSLAAGGDPERVDTTVSAPQPAALPVCPSVHGSRSADTKLEDWVLLGLKLGHPLPVVAGLDLNQEPAREPMDTL